VFPDEGRFFLKPWTEAGHNASVSPIQPILTPSIEILAKQGRAFLVERVAEQAVREQAPLSEIELKMLDFGEDDAGELDMATSDAFDERYDKREYEAKITTLIKRAYAFDKEHGGIGNWDAAIQAAKNQDFYLHVMLDQAGLGPPQEPEKLKDLIPEKKELLQLFIQLAVFLGGGYVVFFRLSSDWNKWVGLVLWLLAMWGVTRIGKRQT